MADLVSMDRRRRGFERPADAAVAPRRHRVVRGSVPSVWDWRGVAWALVLAWAGLACAVQSSTEKSGPQVDFDRAFKDYSEEHYYDAVLKFTDFIREHPGSVLVDQAIYYRGMSHFKQKDWVMATADFERLVRDFPESRFASDAEYQLAEAYWEQSRKPTYDQEETRLAIRQWERALARHPDSPRADAAREGIRKGRERLAEKRYNTARFYLTKLKYRQSALVYFGIVIDEYGDTSWAAKAHRQRLEAYLDDLEVEKALIDYEWLLERGEVDDALRRRMEEYGALVDGEGMP
jgi:outer membrane protein assembly factor BamD